MHGDPPLRKRPARNEPVPVSFDENYITGNRMSPSVDDTPLLSVQSSTVITSVMISPDGGSGSGVAVGVAVAVGLTVGAGVTVGLTVGAGVAVGLIVGAGVAVAVGLSVGITIFGISIISVSP